METGETQETVYFRGGKVKAQDLKKKSAGANGFARQIRWVAISISRLTAFVLSLLNPYD